MNVLKKTLAIAAMTLATSPAFAALATYNVTTKFIEPDTDPANTWFVGTFTFDTVSKTVSGLQGWLSESMTGFIDYNPATGINGTDDMSWVHLTHQLDATYDAALGGFLVTTFLNSTTSTFTSGDGWTPGVGMTRNNGSNNAYARVFVNTTDPLAALTSAQINKLAYADCTAGGMMGPTCMTGTSVAGYGRVGTMSGYPVSQSVSLLSVTVPVPEADRSAMMVLGLGLLAWAQRQQRRSM
ncbi:PEP-CTERM sorting domain-containing protein [Methylophilus sp. 13]|uniref:PEP-CTERM sorting domain-containing protein n=1 Tax=Methylophilus sp. 13 TaxID=2781018 RepID=UPI00188E265F|nr:PEP-CTERM sorting domain-containing protein [Methylophilus sp. 13]MBF5039483.1 PEP-CTERM sorting domain-containing protein [Methylophilus sp. 13]